MTHTFRASPQEPHYGDEVEGSSQVQDEVSRFELASLQQALVRRGDVRRCCMKTLRWVGRFGLHFSGPSAGATLQG